MRTLARVVVVALMEYAVINKSSKLTNAQVCYLVEAVAQQVVDFCARWSLQPPAVAFYASDIGLPADDIVVCTYLDQLDVPDAIAYHTVDAAGRPVCYMLPPSDPLDATDLSHEILEAIGDPTADRWMKRPDGSEEAVEVADPVQGNSYTIDTHVITPTPVLAIKVSNFVLPSYFDPNGKAPFDAMGVLTEPFTVAPGGYAVVLSADGNETDVFGDRTAASKKWLDRGSRLARRLRVRRAA